MSMRAKKRAQVARTVPMDTMDMLDAALLPIRRARVALLRNPVAMAEIKDLIKRSRGPGARVLRTMLAEDIRLMHQMDRLDARRGS